MRLLCVLGLLGLAACGPKVVMEPSPFEEDDPRAGDPAPRAEEPTWEQLPEAAPGPGSRTGTVARADLQAVLAAGPGELLRSFEVTSELDGERFVGWRLVRFLGERRFPGVDLVVGDV